MSANLALVNDYSEQVIMHGATPRVIKMVDMSHIILSFHIYGVHSAMATATAYRCQENSCYFSGIYGFS